MHLGRRLTLTFIGAKDMRPWSSASRAVRSLTATIRSDALLCDSVTGAVPTCMTLRLPKVIFGSPDAVQSVTRLYDTTAPSPRPISS